MTTPLIGITTSKNTFRGNKIPLIGAYESYVEAIRHAGAIPILIPVSLTNSELDAFFDRVDGFLFPGGGDIDPKLFNGRPHKKVYGIDPDRDRTELHLVKQAAELNKPFFGICRGIQVINVALGGTLYTHIADQLDGALRHDWYPDIPREYLAHPVTLKAGSRLAETMSKTSIETNSLHHQAVEQTAPGLIPVAWAPDGLIEAVELPGHRFGVGVQWHPENLQAYPEMRALFKAFIDSTQK